MRKKTIFNVCAILLLFIAIACSGKKEFNFSNEEFNLFPYHLGDSIFYSSSIDNYVDTLIVTNYKFYQKEEDGFFGEKLISDFLHINLAQLNGEGYLSIGQDKEYNEFNFHINLNLGNILTSYYYVEYDTIGSYKHDKIEINGVIYKDVMEMISAFDSPTIFFNSKNGFIQLSDSLETINFDYKVQN